MPTVVKTRFRALIVAGLALVFLAGTPLWAGPREWDILEDANDVLEDLTAIPLKGIPTALLRDAQGVAIIPDVVKAGFILGGRHGRGVLLMREPDGSWSQPIFITLSGVSIGHQLGVQMTDLVLVFKTRKGLDRIRQGKLTLGADLAVAAGPVGRQAEVSTDAMLRSEILSYSRSRGLFAGVSLEGAALLMDQAATEAGNRPMQGGWLDHPNGPAAPRTPPGLRLQMKLALLTAPGAAPAPVEPPTLTPNAPSPPR